MSANAFGFERGRGAYANASKHLRKPYVLVVDLKDFFPSITYGQISRLFQSFGFGEETTKTLSSLCSLRGTLPQGAPTSPRIADLIFEPVDIVLAGIARESGAIYTRYADDLSFSLNARPPENLMNRLVDALDKFGFRLNHEKTRMAGPGMRRRITGFVINERVQPDRETRRQLRAKFHRLPTGNLNFPELKTAQGWASFVYSYDERLGQKYLKTVNEVRRRRLLDLGNTESGNLP